MPSPVHPQPKPPIRPRVQPSPATPVVWFAGLAGVVAILLLFLFLAVSF